MKNANRVFLVFALLTIYVVHATGQGVAINVTGSSPHSSAGLDIDFTDRGLLIPRLTTSQRDAISNAAIGLQIYNITTNCLQIFMPSGWKDVVCNCESFPSSAFSNPGIAGPNAPVVFGANSGGLSYAWSFESGSPSTSNLQSPTVTWSATGTYNITLTVTDGVGCSSTTSSAISVEPISSPSLVCSDGWDVTAGPNTGDLGCVTFTYRGFPVTYTTVRAADGNEWLRQNVGSSRVALSVNDALAYGDLFQWGRWDDGHQDRNSPASTSGPLRPNNVSPGPDNNFYYNVMNANQWWANGAGSNTWDGAVVSDASTVRGVDPCKLSMGNGWRLPTAGAGGEWAAFWSAEGLTTGSGAAAAAFASTLKLTLAGTRSASNASVIFDGAVGFYTSSTPHISAGNYGMLLSFQGGSADPTTSNEFRGSGHSVRCVRD